MCEFWVSLQQSATPPQIITQHDCSIACCITFLFCKDRVTNWTIRKGHRSIFVILKKTRIVRSQPCRMQRGSKCTAIRLKSWHLNCKAEIFMHFYMHACYGSVGSWKIGMRKWRITFWWWFAKAKEKLLLIGMLSVSLSNSLAYHSRQRSGNLILLQHGRCVHINGSISLSHFISSDAAQRNFHLQHVI